ncbi:SAM-dependent methyltransferase [Corynebacterium poyangense]|uniref:SAM-dependent methyltransferase n=1 Tax=Corynebacterium poyangense TaxID=2684405 RepID=UPI001CCBA65F|nr:cyclopropane-fatty-acyl-phospholipid synthase family protein [Corynebacterium poyangense]
MPSSDRAPMNIAEMVEALTVAQLPLRISAFDGSATGPEDSPFRLDVANEQGLAYIATAPGDLGLARAYITGGLEISGEHPAHPYRMFDILQQLYKAVRRPDAATVVTLLRSLRRYNALKIQPIPEVEQTSRWRKALVEGLSRHSKERDKESVSSHYDVGNNFYELVLGDSMTYTCAYYPSADTSLVDAQDNKHRLVFEKLHLKEGDRLLDVGCGWGQMVMYAARRGVKSLGVTLSQQQYEWARAAIAEEGLEGLAEVRCLDYRDVKEEDFDAVSAIGILEHIGRDNYENFFTQIYSKLKPGGRMLNHCITYPDNRFRKTGSFIDRYIFPDGELAGSGTIISTMQDAGFEVLHEENLRYDYQRTLHDWCENLKAHWDQATTLVGEPIAKLWGLYMAGSEWGFEHNIVQLHQVLGVKLLDDGSRGDIPRRFWWQP